MIDFHSHVIAKIDDGSQSLDESLQMLEEAYESGTDVIVLTPHYYPREEHTLDEFLKKRKKRFDELSDYCSGKKYRKCFSAARLIFTPIYRISQKLRSFALKTQTICCLKCQ